jgi:hypothetical protein
MDLDIRQRQVGVNMSVDVEILGVVVNLCLDRADKVLPRVDTIILRNDTPEPRVDYVKGTPTKGAGLANHLGAGARPTGAMTLGWVHVGPVPGEWGRHWVTNRDIIVAHGAAIEGA